MPHAALSEVEALHTRLDEALAAARRTCGLRGIGAGERPIDVGKLRIFGDVAIIGGPFHVTADDGEAAMVALCLIDVVSLLARAEQRSTAEKQQTPQARRHGFSAVVSTGDAHIALLGTRQPTLEIFGPASRTSAAMCDALPRGALVATQHVVLLLARHGIALPRWANDVSFLAPQTWRLRAAGVVTVRPLSISGV